MLNQIERIEHMSKILEQTNEVTAELFEALEKYAQLREKYRELIEYYNSDLWTKDFDSQMAGDLPDDLNQITLNEDTIYDLIVENRILTVRMLELATDNVKNS